MHIQPALNTATYHHLKNMILSGELEFYKLYSETQTAAMLNVSRTPVRDALVRLTQEHYIDVLPSKGFMLHKPNAEDLRNARHFRLAIEGYCAAILAEQSQEAGQSVIARMEEILQQQTAVADKAHSKTFWHLDTAFHTELVSWVQNDYFDSLYTNCNYLFTSLPVSNFFEEKRHKSTLQEHTEILHALKSGNSEQAREAVVHHIEESTRAILKDVGTA